MRYPRDMQGYGGRPARRRLAGRRARRRPVRAQLRGGRRELRSCTATPPPRPSSREIVGAAALAGHAPLEHGIDLRIRRPRRLLAAARPLHRARRAGHGLRRRHRAGPLAGAGRRDAGGRLGDRQPRPEVDRLPRRHPPRPRRADIAEAIRLHTEVTGEPPARLVHRPLLGQHRRSRHRGGRLRLRLRHLRRRPALLARACRPPAAHHPLHARRQRHALRHAPGLQLRRPVLRLPQGQLRHPLRRGRGRAARR